MDLIKSFGRKIWDKIKDHLASYIARYILLFVGVIFLTICFFLRKWAFAKYSFEMYGLVWLLFLSIFLFLIGSFLYCTLRDKDRLKNEHDIINAIDSWFTKGNSYRQLVEKNVNYYFTGVEKHLNLRRGSSKRYLPMISFRHGYGFEMGKKTFKLTNLTPEKDPRNIFEKHFKPIFTGEEKEVFLSCKDIDRKLGWPEGATKSWLLSRPHSYEKFEIRDEGRDKIRIVQKK